MTASARAMTRKIGTFYSAALMRGLGRTINDGDDERDAMPVKLVDTAVRGIIKEV